MKNIVLFLLLIAGSFGMAQDQEYDKIKVKTPEDCKKAEPKVLEAADFIIDSPLETDNRNLYAARALIIDWMSNTPEHTFSLDGNTAKLAKGKNISLLAVFMACQTKFVLENPDSSKEKHKVQLAAFSSLAEYCMNNRHGVDMTKAVIKLIDAYKNGKME